MQFAPLSTGSLLASWSTAAFEHRPAGEPDRRHEFPLLEQGGSSSLTGRKSEFQSELEGA